MIKLKIEIETKELTALLDYIKGQREPIDSADDLAKSIMENLPHKIDEVFVRYQKPYHSKQSDDAIVNQIMTTCDEHGCSVNIQPCVENANWKS